MLAIAKRSRSAVIRELLPRAEHNLAVALENEDPKRAATLYERALAAHETRATLVRLARLHHRAGRFDDATTLYKRALTLAKAELDDTHSIVRAITVWLGDANSKTYR